MQTCHRRLNIGTFHSLDLGAKINTAMKRNAEKKKNQEILQEAFAESKESARSQPGPLGASV